MNQESQEVENPAKSSGCPQWLVNAGLFLPPLLFIVMVIVVREYRPDLDWSTPGKGASTATAGAGTPPAPPASAPGTVPAAVPASTSAPPPSLALGPGSAEKGEVAYNTYCVICHQPGGAGKVGFAPFIRNPDFLAATSDEFLHRTIVQGRPGTAMTPWAHLQPEVINDIVAYPSLRSRSGADRQGRDRPVEAPPRRRLQGRTALRPVLRLVPRRRRPRLRRGRPGPAIGNAGFLSVASDDYIFHTIKHGRRGTAMRPFSGSVGLANLSDEQIADIISYLRSGGEAAPAVAATGPDPKRGKMHFDANCAACHQPNGAGRPGIAPSIGNRDFLALASDEFIKQTVRQGRMGTSMVQRPDLSDEVLDDIIAYLRNLPVETVVDIEVDHSRDLASQGNVKTGHDKFGLYCAACHGPTGQGYVGRRGRSRDRASPDSSTRPPMTTSSRPSSRAASTPPCARSSERVDWQTSTNRTPSTSSPTCAA